ncbi:hypothetical protein B0H11DRAFT_1387675 [Mycena galericulata]|nr:hypothetical protein B0H11DRAFT_1387675 [Mycena galericulata]
MGLVFKLHQAENLPLMFVVSRTLVYLLLSPHYSSWPEASLSSHSPYICPLLIRMASPPECVGIIAVICLNITIAAPAGTEDLSTTRTSRSSSRASSFAVSSTNLSFGLGGASQSIAASPKPPTQAAQPTVVPLSTHSTLSKGAVVGTAVGICSLILLVLLLGWLRRRWHRRAAAYLTVMPFAIPSTDVVASVPSKPTSAVPDHSDSDPAHSVTTVRQRYLQSALRAAREKIGSIEDLERRAISGRQGTTPGRLMQVFSSRGWLSGGPGSPDADVAFQLRRMTARIRELEAQIQSPWARGLSDEPPPGYLEEEP